jgi:predicted RNase H-like nuclease (RuvC/YqgF family)
MSGGKTSSFLPKVANATPKDGYSPPVSVPGLIGSTQADDAALRTAGAPHFFLSAEDRLRNMLYEREQEAQRLRQENAVLRQLERRQQKEIDQLESSQDEAPRVIRALREELAAFKTRAKEYTVQKAADDRIMRHQAEAIRNLKDKSSKMKQLLRARDLEERQNLRERLDVERLRYEELDRSEKVCAAPFEETSRKCQ